jgi:serine/threonine-protein kinase RsbW
MPDNGWIWSFEKRMASDPCDGHEVVARILEEMQKADWAEHDVFGVHLAIEEALVNAIKHGNRKDPTKMVEVVCRVSRDRVQIRITDEGDGFDPEAVPDPTDEENLEIPSGRGLMLMRCYMTAVQFNERGNEVSMEKLRSRDDEGEEDEDDNDR